MIIMVVVMAVLTMDIMAVHLDLEVVGAEVTGPGAAAAGTAEICPGAAAAETALGAAAAAGAAETCPGTVTAAGMTAPGIGEAADPIAVIDHLLEAIPIEAAMVIPIEAVMATHTMAVVMGGLILRRQWKQRLPRQLQLKQHLHSKPFSYCKA